VSDSTSGGSSEGETGVEVDSGGLSPSDLEGLLLDLSGLELNLLDDRVQRESVREERGRHDDGRGREKEKGGKGECEGLKQNGKGRSDGRKARAEGGGKLRRWSFWTRSGGKGRRSQHRRSGDRGGISSEGIAEEAESSWSERNR
jgi:hypothetical protein